MKTNLVRAWVLSVPALMLFLATGHAQLLDPQTLTKYIDPLPQPRLSAPVGVYRGYPLYVVHVKQAYQQMHSELPNPTRVFTFNGVTPGPSIATQVDQPIAVRYINELPANHMFHVDTTIPVMAGMGWGQSSRFVPHLHGGDVDAVYDGFGTSFIYPGQETTYIYPNKQADATLWYYDNSCGITRLNGYAGLAGFYQVIDPHLKLNMPDGPFALKVMIQDRQFYANGQLFYPDQWAPEFFGNVALVNGVVWPKLEVDPRKYRFLMLNACEDRFVNLKLYQSDAHGVVPAESVPGPAFWMVGTEQGLVNKTVKLNDPNDPNAPRLLVAPAERRDFIVDFAGQEGKYFLVHNNASAPFDGTFPPDPTNPLPEMFLIHVSTNTARDPYTIPMTPGDVHQPKPVNPARKRLIELREFSDPQTGHPKLALFNGKHFREPTTEFPELNYSEEWSLVNTTDDVQPVHLHLVSFQIQDRTPFDVEHYLNPLTYGEIIYTGPPELPQPQELGRRDMTNAPPGYVTRIMTSKFNRVGRYAYQCHITSYEENDMMRPFEVLPSGQKGNGGSGADAMALKAELGRSSPEPFRSQSNIALNLPVRQLTRLSVLDVTGREVRTLVDGALEAGAHHYAWDGSDQTGAKAPAGVYYYRLQVGNSVVDSKRATLLR